MPKAVRLLIITLAALTLIGCPPLRQRLSIDARVTHDDKPLPSAWVIWSWKPRMKRTGADGAVVLEVDDRDGLPSLVIHHAAGARPVRAHTFTLEQRSGIKNNSTVTDARAAMALDGFDGERVTCDGVMCRADISVKPGEQCNGQFFFAPSDGHAPLRRRIREWTPTNTPRIARAIAPAGNGAAAFIGRCHVGKTTRSVFASGAYAPPAEPPAASLERDLQPLLDPRTPIDALREGAEDPREELQTAALRMLEQLAQPQYREIPGAAAIVRKPGQPVLPRHERVRGGADRAARDVLRAAIAEGEPLAPLPASQARLALAVLGDPRAFVRDDAPRHGVVCERRHVCSIVPACEGRLAFYNQGKISGSTPGLRVMLHRTEVLPSVSNYDVGVLFAGTCSGRPILSAQWVDPLSPKYRWRMMLADLDDPGRRAGASEALVGTVIRPVSGLSVGGWPRYGTDQPGHAAVIVGPVAAAAIAAEGQDRARIVDALDALAKHLLTGWAITDADRLHFAEATKAVLPFALERASNAATPAPLSFISVQAMREASATGALAATFDQALVAGEAATLVGQLPRTRAVSAALGARLARVLPECADDKCRAATYTLMSLEPNPVNALAALARLAVDREAARPAVHHQTPTPALVELLVEMAFGEDGRGRREAALALRALRPSPERVLDRALAALDGQWTRQAGLIALGGQPSSPAALEALVTATRGDTLGDRLDAAESLAAMDTRESLRHAIELAERADYAPLRIGALKGLSASRGDPAAVHAAMKRIAANDADESVRNYAAYYLREASKR